MFQKLCHKFTSPAEADAHFRSLEKPPDVQVESTDTESVQPLLLPGAQHVPHPWRPPLERLLLPEAQHVPHPRPPLEPLLIFPSVEGVSVPTTLHSCEGVLHLLPPAQQLETLSKLLLLHISEHASIRAFPADFLKLVMCGMKNANGAMSFILSPRCSGQGVRMDRIPYYQRKGCPWDSLSTQ